MPRHLMGGGSRWCFADPVHHTLVYTAHEVTTHLYRPGLVSGATPIFGVSSADAVRLRPLARGLKRAQPSSRYALPVTLAFVTVLVASLVLLASGVESAGWFAMVSVTLIVFTQFPRGSLGSH